MEAGVQGAGDQLVPGMHAAGEARAAGTWSGLLGHAEVVLEQRPLKIGWSQTVGVGEQAGGEQCE